MIPRILEKQLLELTGYFPVVSLNGPRQSGKTTLIKKVFSDLPYVSMEDPDTRLYAEEDARGFLMNYPAGAVFDEVQRSPQLFSYIQGIVDNNPTIRFVLSGSQNFLLTENITQSLAGRVGIMTLLPFSMEELQGEDLLSMNPEEVMYRGFYPRLYDKNIPPDQYYPNYLATYVERDVRLIKNIGDLGLFTRFMKLCAGRAGQLLNYSNLANDTGISVNTVKTWLSVLEASYIVFRLSPYHKSFNKRLTKSPKLYFYDTGLLCELLQLSSFAQLDTHYNRGGIFENLCILEMNKYFTNRGIRPRIHYWKNNKGKEIDALVEHDDTTRAVEIKSGKTYTSRFMENLTYWQELSGSDPEDSYVLYAGDREMKLKDGNLVPWNMINRILD